LRSHLTIFSHRLAGQKERDADIRFNWIRKLKDELVFDGVAQTADNGGRWWFREEPAYEFWIVPIEPNLRGRRRRSGREEVEYPPTTRPVRKPTQP
jgi:hypothetical protein